MEQRVASQSDLGSEDELVLAVPPEPEAIRVARLFVSAACRHAGFAEERIDDVKIAVSEAVTNAIKAHLDAGVTTPVRVVVRGDRPPLVLEVTDAGRGFEVESALAPGAVTPAAGIYEGSLGLVLIESLFPGMTIHRNEDRGMTIGITLTERDAVID